MFTTIQEVSTEPFELRILHTAHSVLAYPAFLAGYRTVQEAMEDGFFNTYVRTFLMTTYKSLPAESPSGDLEGDINQLLNRLTQSGDVNLLSELCRDGASKLSTFVIPILLDRLEQGKEVSSLTFLLAAYGHYLQAGVDDKGQEYTVDEPELTQHDWTILANGDVLSLLETSAFASAHLRSFPPFMAQYKSYRNQIACYGLVFSLKQTLCAFWEEETEAHK